MIQLRKLLIILAVILCSNRVVVYSQNYEALPQSIFEVLRIKTNDMGEVQITQSNRLLSLVGRVSPKYGRVLSNEINTQVVYGYRIIYFNSNNPKAKATAYLRQEELRKLAPEYATYIRFNAPFWRLQLGDFRTKAEALEVLKELKKTLPKWHKEAYVVKDRIRLIGK